MIIIKRCEKEVVGSWTEKQQQAKLWLDHFVPHYTGRCVPDGGCPAKHSPMDDDSKKWLDSERPLDKAKIDELVTLIDRMKADVTLYIHGYNTCAVECAHGERTALTSKRIEYWSNWEGKCRLLQLLHNLRTRTTGEALLHQLGWQVAEGVTTQLTRIDRDKAKHHLLKTTPEYNARQKAIRFEKKMRAATDPELVARAAQREEKTREKRRHYYSARKQLLYEQKREERKGEDVAEDGRRKKRGRLRKRKPEEKENEASAERRKKADTTQDSTALTDAQRPPLQAIVMNHRVGVKLVLHPAMQELTMR
jgi:hypothetical protein